MGYLKEAMVNYRRFWDGRGIRQDIMAMEELIAEFDLARVHKAGAMFDDRNQWMNRMYIRKSTDELTDMCVPHYTAGYITEAEAVSAGEYLKVTASSRKS